MREEYDFSRAEKNPYKKSGKRQTAAESERKADNDTARRSDKQK